MEQASDGKYDYRLVLCFNGWLYRPQRQQIGRSGVPSRATGPSLTNWATILNLR